MNETSPKILSSPALSELVETATARFAAQFRRPPERIVAAPGRVNLIGGHIDYNGGIVMPMTVPRYTVIAAARQMQGSGPDRTSQIASTAFDDQQPVNLPDAVEPSQIQKKRGHWTRYVAGVIAGFAELGHRPAPFDAVVHSSVPPGSGLSSSAALTVATATLLESFCDQPLDKMQKAILCQQAEHRFAGVPCGMMDPVSSLFGQEDTIIKLDCRDQILDLVPFDSPDIGVLIIDSNTRHELAGSEYTDRRKQCSKIAKKLGVRLLRDIDSVNLEETRRELSDLQYRRLRHVVTENARSEMVAGAISRGDWTAAGAQLFASHDSLRTDYEVSCRELDVLVDLAGEIGLNGGVFGARMTGGGFGGSVVALVRTPDLSVIWPTIRDGYQAQTNVTPGAFVARPARGAHVIA